MLINSLHRPRASSVSVLAAFAIIIGQAVEAAPNHADRQPPTIVPTKPIVLFNGKDLSHFYTWLVDHKYSDPKRVFTVVEQIDGAPAIRVSGENWGGFITKDAYADYHLVVEYRWGELSWGERRNRAMDGGILVHARGPDGNYEPDFNGPWMSSIEYQLIEGATGDLIIVRGHGRDGTPIPAPTMTSTVRTLRNGQTNWDPQGEVMAFDENNRRRLCVSYKDPDWKSVLGYRGANDVEKPVGEWNKAEIICKGDSVVFILNGQVVNRATRCSYTSGRLLFQSEGAEHYYRRIELHPVR